MTITYLRECLRIYLVAFVQVYCCSSNSPQEKNQLKKVDCPLLVMQLLDAGGI